MMKLNKSKGKVHPSPSSSSSSSSSSSVCLPVNPDPISSLNHLLPAAILTLISVLSLQDREVLAYMITRSLNSSPSPSPSPATARLDKSKKPRKCSDCQSGSGSGPHKSPRFECECFECYTAYWFRWDSSPNRELIHQAIEAFEDHLAKSEQPKKTHKTRRRSDKHNPVHPSSQEKPPEIQQTPADGCVGDKEQEREREEEDGSHGKQQQEQQQQHKGLATKMLPDVIGFFNSRLWNLWSPNV